LGVAVNATYVMPSFWSEPALADMSAARWSSMETLPPSSSSANSVAFSTFLSSVAVLLFWDEWASSAITAKRLPAVADSLRTSAIALGKVCMVQTMIFLPLARA